MNNLNHAKYIVVWRKSRTADIQIEEYGDRETAIVRREVLSHLSYVNQRTITLYEQANVPKGEEVTRITLKPPDLH